MGLPEIIPPQRGQVTRIEPARITQTVPGVYVGGYFSAPFNAMVWDARAKGVRALDNLNKAEASLITSMASVTAAETVLREKLFDLQELPERLGHRLAVNRVNRANEYREAQHAFEKDEMRRNQEIVCAETDVNRSRVLRTQSRTALVDAEQQLQAQMEFGGMKYVLQHKKAALEIMDVELDMEERKKLLKDYLAKGTEQAAQTDDLTDAEIDDALQDRLQRLMAKGLDTTNIEAAIAKRRQR